MSGSRPPSPSKQVINQFGDKIHDDLKQYDKYGSGDEVPFIKEFVQLMDQQFAYDGNQLIFCKGKMAHSSPFITYPGISKYKKGSIELADLLVYIRYIEQDSVVGRRAFFSQTKCVKKSKTGRGIWHLDKSQAEFMKEKPPFILNYQGATRCHDISESNESFLNYSFVSDIHRPFLYNPKDLSDFTKDLSSYNKFVYGKHPVVGRRLLYSKLKMLLSKKYGSETNKKSNEYHLIEDVFELGNLDYSSSTNVATDGGDSSDSAFGVVQIDVSFDQSYLNFDHPLFQELSPDKIFSDEIDQEIFKIIEEELSKLENGGVCIY